jgi:hypothetical protein
MLLDELGEVVESRRCDYYRPIVSIVTRFIHPERISRQRQQAHYAQREKKVAIIPMASVMNPKPTMDPRYPTSGKIHISARIEKKSE